MHGLIRSFAVVGLLASLSLLTGFVALPLQDGQTQAHPFYQATRLNFAVLQYTNSLGTTVEVPSSTITKIWLLADLDGDLRMEIAYENGDFSSLLVRDFHVIRRSNNLASVDVPVIRSELSGMAFPGFK